MMSNSYNLDVATQLRPEMVLELLFPETRIDFVKDGAIHGRTSTGIFLTIWSPKFPEIDTLGYLFGIDPTVTISLRLSHSHDAVAQEQESLAAFLRWIKHEQGAACLLYETTPLALWKEETLVIEADEDMWTEAMRKQIDLPHTVEQILPQASRLD